MKFLKYTLASITGTIISAIIIVFAFIAIITTSLEKDPVTVKDNSVLKLDLTKFIVERTPKTLFSDMGKDNNSGISGLNTIKAAIKKAKDDPKIKGIYLNAGVFTGSGLATIEEVRNALLDFKTTGKFIIAYGENYNQKAYYISTTADKIILNPLGSVDFKGFNAQIMFFKNAMEKLEVDMQIIRGPGNKFKSAVEPFMLDHMSEANKEQTTVFLGALWNNVLENISKSRNISVEKLQEIADNLKTYDSKEALKTGIVDMLGYQNDVDDELKTLCKIDQDKDIEFISLSKYSETVRPENRKAKDKIAIIYAQGGIESGDGDEQTIGSDRIAKAIRKAAKDSSIKAIVFRVNSPGGSALASEVIYNELVLAKKEKPLVVSMGDYAASGGYYISCPADKIYAQPNTITGSIGVFGMIPNFQKLLNNKLGLTFDGVKTAENADIFSTVQPLTPFQTETIRHSIDIIYKTFIDRVAKGRNMTTEQVDAIGQGRVWSGTDALRIGLVDELGGIDDAIKAAAGLAKIENYKIKELPKLKDPLDEIFDNLNAKTSIESAVTKDLGNFGAYYKLYKELTSMDKIQARLPYIIEIY